jgi:hypothetical protein
VKLTFTERFAVPREKLFAALTDPESLRACIEGCEEMARTGDDVYEAKLKIGVAGIKGRYKGKVELRDKRPPESFTLSVDGSGAPGFVKGTGRLELAEAPGGATELRCEGEAQVGGLVAAVGSRLIEAAARKLAGDFFAKLRARVEAPCAS